MRRMTMDDWRRAVFRSQAADMTAATKVLCLYLADHASGRDVSVPRDQIATDLGIHKARVAERLSRAVSAGFLASLSKGYPGHTAVYRVTLPEAVVPRQRVQQSGTHMETAPSDAFRYAERYPFPRSMDTAPQDAITTTDLAATTAGRNVGNNAHEAPASRKAAS